MTGLIIWSVLLFVGGLCLGAAWGIGHGEKLGRQKVWAKLRARAEERRAARWLEGVRETRGGTVMPPDRTALVLSYPPADGFSTYAHAAFAGAVDPPELARDDVARRMLAAGMYWDEEQQDWVPDPAVWYPPEPSPLRSLGGKVHDIHGGPGQDCWCGYVGADHAATYATAADEWDAHVAQAVALTEETDEEFTARLAGWADDIIAAARTAADPYWDGQL